MWPFGTVEYEQSQNNTEGFQICYPLTSLSTVEKPTPAEIATRHTLNMMWETTVDALKRFCEKYAVKPIYNHSMSTKDGKKFVDPAKPLRTYIKLATNGKGKTSNVIPFRCISVHGSCHPVVHWDGIYWGAHGRNSYGASARLKVTEMNFSLCMIERSILYRRRMLAPNTTPVEEENESEDQLDLDEVFSDSDDSVFEK